MRAIGAALLLGIMGVTFYIICLTSGTNEEWISFGAYPGLVTSFILVQGGFHPIIVFGVGGLVQFILFAIVGFVLTVPTYFIG